jgi:hypothetical protein
MGAIPYYALILVEPALFQRSVSHVYSHILCRGIAYATAQPDVWPTIQDAMHWHKARAPWEEWHPDTLQVFSVSHQSSVDSLILNDITSRKLTFGACLQHITPRPKALPPRRTRHWLHRLLELQKAYINSRTFWTISVHICQYIS